jgi:hypothetical protein
MSRDGTGTSTASGTERLFEEYTLVRVRHSDKDPSDFWYKGEMGFFDFTSFRSRKTQVAVCLEFPATSTNAQKNGREWERRGQDVVASMIEKFSVLYMTDHDSEHEYEHDGVELDVFRTKKLRYVLSSQERTQRRTVAS